MMTNKISVIYLACTLMVMVLQNAQSAAINPSSANGSETNEESHQFEQMMTEKNKAEENSILDGGNSEEVSDNDDADEMMMGDDPQMQGNDEMSSFFPQTSLAGVRYFKNKLAGKQEPVRRNLYSFGLGKREPVYNPGLYFFGLGKRSSVPSSYNPGLYSFGLGKRNPSPSYNPTPNRLYAFGLGKRLNNENDRETTKKTSGSQQPTSFSRFNFGLGKRSSGSDDEDESIEQYLSSFANANDEELSVSKRTPPSQQQAAFFPAYIRSYSDINNGVLFPAGARTNMFQTERKPSSSLTFKQYPTIDNSALMGKRLPVYNFGLGK